MEAKLKEILIRAKKDVFGNYSGDALTKLKGDGLDFREIKEYEFGDDVKKINWKATAKTGATKVNIFNIDRELNIVIIFLASGSLHFGTVRFKQEVATEIVATLAYSSIKNNNKLSSLIFSSNEDLYIPPSKKIGAVYEISNAVFNTNCLQKEVNFANLCNYINSFLKQKSLIFLVGDFLEEEIDLSQIAYRHEIYALIVRDRFEENPQISGEYEFVSPIDFSHIEASMSKQNIKEYTKLLNIHDNRLLEHFYQYGISSGKIYTDEDLYLRLNQIIKG